MSGGPRGTKADRRLFRAARTPLSRVGSAVYKERSPTAAGGGTHWVSFLSQTSFRRLVAVHPLRACHPPAQAHACPPPRGNGWPWQEGAGALGSTGRGTAPASSPLRSREGRWDTAGAGEQGHAPGLGPCSIKVTSATGLGKRSSPDLCSCLPQPHPAGGPRAKPGPEDEGPGADGRCPAAGAALLGPSAG